MLHLEVPVIQIHVLTTFQSKYEKKHIYTVLKAIEGHKDSAPCFKKQRLHFHVLLTINVH